MLTTARSGYLQVSTVYIKLSSSVVGLYVEVFCAHKVFAWGCSFGNSKIHL